MLEMHFSGSPVLTRHMANKVHKHAQRQFSILTATEDRPVAHLVIQPPAIPFIDQSGERVVLMIRKGIHHILQRLFQRRRTQTDIANQT